jgi:aspartate racemase
MPEKSGLKNCKSKGIIKLNSIQLIKMDKVIGILGGMGPEAAADLCLKIIKNTPAKKDQDHLRVILDNNPKIPDPVKATLGEGEDPTLYLIETAKNLERAGADFIIIACNTAHYYLERIRSEINIPIINGIKEVGLLVKKIKLKKVGLLASSGTLKSGIYQKEFKPLGIEIIEPSKAGQKLVMKAIYGIKAGHKEKDLLLKVGKELIQKGSQALIEGCTEIPLVLRKGDFPVPLIESTETWAKVCISKAKEST